MPEIIANRYHLLEKIGEGGMGAVHKVHDRLTDQILALKRVLIASSALEFASRPPNSSESELRLSLTEEFRMLASLRHPNIITVLDYGFDAKGQPFYTMRLLEDAQTLTQYAYNMDAPMSEQVNFLIDLLRALAYLHRRGIIHRDLKPDNVLITPDGELKVMDFGLAQSAEADSQQNLMAGTLAYIAPETLLGQPLSQQADLFAVGVIAYELFTGKHPFDVSNPTQLIYSILHQQPDASLLDPQLASVVMRLMSKAPDERYDSAQDVIDALCLALDIQIPQESVALRESYLQASEFAGRGFELSQLTEGLTKALDGKGSTWLIGGESGVGKSRLMEEVRIRALVRGANVLTGQATESGGVPYVVWRSILPHLLLSTEVSDLEASILKPLVVNIGQLLERSIADAPEMNGVSAQKRLSMTIADLLRRQTIPIVLLLEDLQWADESVMLLKEINPLVPELPLLIVGNYRDDEAPTLPEQLPTMQHMTLQRLDDLEMAELSRSMLGDAGTNPQVLSLLKQETEGNAFFMVEVVRALAEEAGRLSEIGRATLPQTVFAGGMRRVISRRLNRVPEWGQPLLNWTAVAGRQINLPMLHDLVESIDTLDDDIRLDEWLTICVNAAVLIKRDDVWLFSHDKLREAILEQIIDEVRPVIYRQVAESIERTIPTQEDPADYADQLARLWQVAADKEKEWHYRQIAARVARELAAYEAAIYHAQRAITVAPRRAPDRLLTTCEMHLIIANMQENLGHYDESIAAFEAGLAIARKQGFDKQTAHALAGLGNIMKMRQDLNTAERLNLEALVIRRNLPDKREVIDSLHNIGTIAVQRNEIEEGLAYFEEALTRATELSATLDIAKACNNIAVTYDLSGRFDEALVRYEQSLELRSTLGDQAGVARVLVNMSGMLIDQEKYDEAEAYVEQGLQQARRIHNRPVLTASLSNRGQIRFYRGNFDSAERDFQEAFQLAQMMQQYRNEVDALAWLAHVVIMTDQYVAAAQYIQNAFALLKAHQMQTNYKKWHLLYLSGKILIEKELVEEGLVIFYALLENPANVASYNDNLKNDLAAIEATVDMEMRHSAQAQAQGKTEDALIPIVEPLLDAVLAPQNSV